MRTVRRARSPSAMSAPATTTTPRSTSSPQAARRSRTEFENVPAGTLDYLAKFVPVRPGGDGGRGLPGPHRREVLPARQRPAARPVRRDPQRRRHPPGRRRAVPGDPEGGPLRLRRQGPGHGRQPRGGAARLRPLQGRALRARAAAAARLRGLRGAGARRERRDPLLPDRREQASPRHSRRFHRAGAGCRRRR